MASDAKIAANRRNAEKSTGPRSVAGKARTRSNARRHGLCVPVEYDAVALEEINELATAFAPNTLDAQDIELATFAAEAQVEIWRVRRAKLELLRAAAQQLRDKDTCVLSRSERAIVAFAQKATTLTAFERYERRALARRNHALRKLRRRRPCPRSQVSAVLPIVFSARTSISDVMAPRPAMTRGVRQSGSETMPDGC
jgi:hypothetical protein